MTSDSISKPAIEKAIKYTEIKTLGKKEVCEVFEVVDSTPQPISDRVLKELYGGYIDTADLIVIPLDCIEIQDVGQ